MHSTVVPVTDVSQVGEARRAAVALANLLDFGDIEKGNIALVATEVATNLVKHAREGRILLRPVERGAAVGIELLALDRGPGMADIERCGRDGYSTSGSPGQGLGAIRRLADCSDVYSIPGIGTAVFAQVWSTPPRPLRSGQVEVGAVSLAKAGEEVCGDNWTVAAKPSGFVALVADGLGHGPQAAEASRVAVHVPHRNPGLAPVELLETVHRALQSTRGAAAAVADGDLDREVVRFAGVGNIAGTILCNGHSRSLVSHNGTLGHQARQFHEFTYPFPRGATLVLHSDGLSARWSLEAYPGLAARHPSLIAGILFRDFGRERDDATVVVLREAEGGAG